MLIRSFDRKKLFILAVWAFMMRVLMLPHDAYKYINATEMVIPVLLVPVCAFILYDRTEIELALVNGTKTTKLFFLHLIPFVVYTVIPNVAFSFAFSSYTDTELDPAEITMKTIPEFVPANYKLLTAISVAVTVLFFFALYSLIRVIVRNCYISLFICFGLNVGISNFSAGIAAMHLPMTNSLFDPLINSYFIGNTVPNAYAEKYPELAGMANIWTFNRLLILAVSLLIFFITYLILRREKLHCGVGE